MKKLSLLLAGIVLASLSVIALKETSKTTILKSYRALTADSNDVQELFNKGLKELGQENWSAALTCFQKAKEKNPQNADVWFRLGYCYDELGRYQDAIEAFKQAIRIKPDDAEAHYNLGVAYGKLDRHQDAVEAYKQAVRIKPDYAEAHYGLGVIYLITGDKDSAFEEYKILKTLDAEQADELFNLIYK